MSSLFKLGGDYLRNFFGIVNDEGNKEVIDDSPFFQTTPSTILDYPQIREEFKTPDAEELGLTEDRPIFQIGENLSEEDRRKAQELIAKPSIEPPTTPGGVISGLPKDILRALPQEIVGLGLQITPGKDAFVPENAVQKLVIGDEPIFDTTEQGKEFLTSITGAQNPGDFPGFVAGLSLGVLDSVFGGKSKTARAIAESEDTADIFRLLKTVFQKADDASLKKMSTDLAGIKTPKLVEQYMKNVNDLSDVVLQVTNQKTGEIFYRAIKKDDVASFEKLIDSGERGISGKESNGLTYHLTSKTPGQMNEAGAIYTGVAKVEDLPLSEIDPPEKFFNIRLDKQKMTPDQKIKFEFRGEKIRPELEAARGKKMTEEEILEATKESSVLQKVITRDETLKANAQLVTTRQRIDEIAKLLDSPGLDAAQREKLIKEELQLRRSLSADLADRGRKLQAGKISAPESEAGIRDNIIKRIQKVSDDDEAIAKKAAEIDWTNKKEVDDFYREFVKPTTKDIFDEYRYNNALSNPRTQARNIMSNILQTFAVRPAVKFTEAGVDAFMSMMTGKQREAFFKEVPIYYKNLFKSIPNAFQDFLDVWKGNKFVTNQDLKDIGGGAIKTFLKDKIGLSDKVAGAFSTIFNIPTKSLESVDRLLMRMISEGEFAALKSRGIDDVVALKQANKTASYSLFRAGLDPKNKTGQGAILSGIDKAINGMEAFRKSVPGMDWFVMFLRTPMNFAKQWIEFSPAGFATTFKAANKKAQIAKALIGSTIMAEGAKMAWDGRTTWGVPTDAEAKKLFFASGKKPYSVKIGEHWVPMMYFGGLAFAMAMPAAFKYYQDESPKALTESQFSKGIKSASAIAEFMSQQTFMEGLGNFVDIFKGDPSANVEKTLAFTAGQTIPWSGLVRYISTIVDPVYRKSNSFLEAVQKDLPYLSKNLESYRLPTGEESTRNISSYLAPYDITKEKEEFNALLELRDKQLQYNKVLSQNDDAVNKKGQEMLDKLMAAETPEATQKVAEEISGNERLKNTVKALVESQAIYTSALAEPFEMFRNNPSGLAKYIYGRTLFLETNKDYDEFQDMITVLKDRGLYTESVRRSLKSLTEKESLEDLINEDINKAKESGIEEGQQENQGEINMIINPEDKFLGQMFDRDYVLEPKEKPINPSILRIIAEDAGFLSREDSPFAKLSLKEKSELFGKGLMEEFFGGKGKVPFLVRAAGETIIKQPIKTGFSIIKIPETLLQGKAKGQSINLPEWLPTLTGGNINTYFQDFQNNVDKGMKIKAALSLSFFEGMLDISALGALAEKTIMPKKVQNQFKLSPKVAQSVVRDTTKQFQFEGIPIAGLEKININGVRSWGDLYAQIARQYRGNDAAMQIAKDHLMTRWKMFIESPKNAETAFETKEFIQ